MTRTLQSAHFPDLSACPDAELAQRWTAMLGRAPRLRPWLERMVRQRRVVLQQSGHGSVEEALWLDLSRWLQEFEALPHFAVTAIAVTVEEPELHDGRWEGTGGKEQAERDGRREGEPRQPLPAQAESPERAATKLESLLSDPAFALAFHCVEARLRPALPEGPIPEAAWFGMLHASASPQALLTPGAQLDAFDATTGKIVWVWGIPNDTAISPTVTYMFKGKQYLATYHGVAIAGTPGATSTGQRDQLTVFSL